MSIEMIKHGKYSGIRLTITIEDGESLDAEKIDEALWQNHYRSVDSIKIYLSKKKGLGVHCVPVDFIWHKSNSQVTSEIFRTVVIIWAVRYFQPTVSV